MNSECTVTVAEWQRSRLLCKSSQVQVLVILGSFITLIIFAPYWVTYKMSLLSTLPYQPIRIGRFPSIYCKSSVAIWSFYYPGTTQIWLSCQVPKCRLGFKQKLQQSFFNFLHSCSLDFVHLVNSFIQAAITATRTHGI